MPLTKNDTSLRQTAYKYAEFLLGASLERTGSQPSEDPWPGGGLSVDLERLDLGHVLVLLLFW